MYMGAAWAHPIPLTVTGAHTLNFNSDLTKHTRRDPKAIEQKGLTCDSALLYTYFHLHHHAHRN